MKDHRYPMWKQLLAFVLAGPPLGSLVLFFGLGAKSESWIQLPAAIWFWLQMTLPTAFFVGFVPALITGFSSAIFRARISGHSVGARTARLVVPVFVGAASSAALPLLVFTTELDFWLALVGALAALICAAWVEWRASVRPNNSFKPKPLRGSA